MPALVVFNTNMAQLFDTERGQYHFLRSHHTLGRNTGQVDSVLYDASASRVHAALEWDGLKWLARDLSRNGTWLDNTRLPAQQSVPVRVGQTLYFGGGARGEGWQFVDDSPPCSLLVGISANAMTLPLKPYLFLPSEAEPQLVVFFSLEENTWMYRPLGQGDDAEAEEHVLAHGDTIATREESWRLFIADTAVATQADIKEGPELTDFEFVFKLSLDEEHTELTLHDPDRRIIDLGERSHHYLLLHLARTRAVEAVRGIDPVSQGWLDSDALTREVGLEMSHVNIMIFRARKQLASLLDSSMDMSSLVERGRGRVRFGTSRFRIYKGQKLTHQLPVQ